MTLPLVAATILAVAIVGAYAFVLHGLRLRYERLDEHLADLTVRVGIASSIRTAPPSTPTQPTERLAPWFALPDLQGGQGSLASLLAAGKPVVLSFTDPRCGPCYELLPDIAGWQRVYKDQLTFALVSSGTPAQNRAMTAEYGVAPASILLQHEHEVSEAFDVAMMPTAILIDPDGRIRNPLAAGSFEVRAMVASALGLALPPPPAGASHAVPVATRGQQAPSLRRPDLEGNPFDFGALRGRPTTILFWSPGCTSCDELLPDMRGWEAPGAAMRLLIVTSGPAALNTATGLRSPMVPDDDRTIRGAFGVEATPSAVVVDGNGRIVTEVARGARAVRRLGDLAFDPASVRVTSVGGSAGSEPATAVTGA